MKITHSVEVGYQVDQARETAWRVFAQVTRTVIDEQVCAGLVR